MDRPFEPADAFFQQAVSFAARAHRNQQRKDGRTPYVAHVVRVALTVRVVFGSDDRVALLAALLHDTIEDTTTDYEDIADRFGDDVARCVAALTKNMALPEVEREDEYHARLAASTWQARLVKLADVYDNLSDARTRLGADVDAFRKSIRHAERALGLITRNDRDHPAIARAADALRVLLEAMPDVGKGD